MLPLTVLTTKIRPSKPRVREEYMTSFMHIFITKKFHELCSEFHRQVHILREIGTNVPHVQGTTELPGPAGPVGAAGLAPWLMTGP
jgi:hypothetical protein